MRTKLLACPAGRSPRHMAVLIGILVGAGSPDVPAADLRGVALHAVNITGADLREADLRHLDADMDLEFVTLVGVRMEGARFNDGVICGPMPEKGGFGCAARPRQGSIDSQ